MLDLIVNELNKNDIKCFIDVVPNEIDRKKPFAMVSCETSENEHTSCEVIHTDQFIVYVFNGVQNELNAVKELYDKINDILKNIKSDINYTVIDYLTQELSYKFVGFKSQHIKVYESKVEFIYEKRL
ncbi:MAG: hypothetical protein ACK5HS_04535 [Mycoplasmatales bacterium]